MSITVVTRVCGTQLSSHMFILITDECSAVKVLCAGVVRCLEIPINIASERIACHIEPAGFYKLRMQN